MGGKSVPALGESNSAYCFGPFRLDPVAGLFFHDDQPVPLTPKVFDALLYLVERNGQLVTKDVLMKVLWADTFVAESNLTQTVFMLRKALAETGNGQRYIITVPGRGYRFAAEVRRVSGNHHCASVERLTSVAEVSSSTSASVQEFPVYLPARREIKSLRHLQVFLAAVAALVIAASAIYITRGGRQHRSPAPIGRNMLAVLPFENLTGDAAQEYLSDGFTEELITQLGRSQPQHLGVIARTSIEKYKQNRVPVGQVGRELGVQYVLEGSVRRNGERVRITAQLIRVSDQTHLWAQEYDRDMKDLLQLQAEIGEEIADAIQLTLGPRPDRSPLRLTRPAANYEAYDLYLEGRYFWEKRTSKDFQQAITFFQKATEEDPGYAQAYAGLADSYAMMSGYGLEPANDYMPKARAAALRALQIDDSIAEAHTSLAIIAENYDYDWQTAEKEFSRAIELNPNYATAHHWYGECLAFQGRFADALAESERARQLDPLSLIIAADNGAILYFSRQYDRAIERFRGVLEMNPGITRAHLVIAAYVQKGRFEDALADIEAWRRTSADAPWISAWEAYLYGRAGQPVPAQLALEKLQQLNLSWHLQPEQFLDVAYAGTTDNDKWLAWLENAYANHSNVLTDLKVDAMYDPLRSDPRFQDLLHRVGLDK